MDDKFPKILLNNNNEKKLVSGEEEKPELNKPEIGFFFLNYLQHNF